MNLPFSSRWKGFSAGSMKSKNATKRAAEASLGNPDLNSWDQPEPAPDGARVSQRPRSRIKQFMIIFSAKVTSPSAPYWFLIIFSVSFACCSSSTLCDSEGNYDHKNRFLDFILIDYLNEVIPWWTKNMWFWCTAITKKDKDKDHPSNKRH